MYGNVSEAVPSFTDWSEISSAIKVVDAILATRISAIKNAVIQMSLQLFQIEYIGAQQTEVTLFIE